MKRTYRLAEGASHLVIWLALVFGAAAGLAQEGKAVDTVRIGVLAHRGVEQAAHAWSPTAAYLEQALPGHRFRIVPLHNEALDQAVADHQVDFVLTQPEQYVTLRSHHGLTAVATLMPLAEGRPVSRFGGVIFTRADRQDIQTLGDLRGKRLCAVYDQSLGAYRMQQWTLHQAGIRLPGDVESVHFTGQPQDRVVAEILAGKADAGFVRTGTLEAMEREGKLRPGQVRLINAQTHDDFPLRHSTDLYPEWPMAVTKGVPEPLTKAVTMALLGIPSDSDAARSGVYHGFSPPGDYAPVENILQALRAHPDRLTRFDFRDITEKYQVQTAAILTLVALLAGSIALRLSQDNRRIKEAARERDLLLSSLGEGVCGIDHDGLCTFVNPAALAMLGLQESDLLDRRRSVFDLLEVVGQDMDIDPSPLRATLLDGRRREGEALVARHDGHRLPVRYSIMPLREKESVLGVVLAFQDITLRKEAEADLRVAAVAFETQEGMIITDAAGHILRVNHAFSEVTGYTAEEVIGKSPAILKSGRHDHHFYTELWNALRDEGHWQGEVWNRRKNGEIYPQWLNITAVRRDEGGVCHYVGTFLDISQRKQAEAQIEYMALYDPLTGLPNRRLLLERLGRALVSRHRVKKYCALQFIDLDNFKTLNDTMGHNMGDELLRQTSERIKSCVREGDTVARLGGDEFVVMLDDLGKDEDEAAATAEMVGEKILAVLNLPYHLGGTEHHGGASMGMTLFQDNEQTVEELLKRADMAMYQAKSAGRNTLRFFDPAMQSAVEARATLEHDMWRGLKQQEFTLFYQPQVDAEGRVQGAEALVRWRHPQQGLLTPASFIPLAESTGLILPLGQQVLEEACQQLAAWQADPATASLTLAVNVSARQFRQVDFVERVRGALMRHGVRSPGLKLELTESLMLEALDDVITRMKALKALGVELSLDDFGTGYSSLSYLKRLPLDQIKIDQSFVRDALSNPNDATLTRTVLALGQTFGLSVIAEGVETEEQRAFLAQHGCRSFQGYLFGRPVPVGELKLPK